MAKDAPKETPAKRAQRTTAADLKEMAARLRDAADQIDGQADRMKKQKLEFVMIEGRQGVEGKTGAYALISTVLASCHRHIKPF